MNRIYFLDMQAIETAPTLDQLSDVIKHGMISQLQSKTQTKYCFMPIVIYFAINDSLPWQTSLQDRHCHALIVPV